MLGLKFYGFQRVPVVRLVTPFMGVWIEITMILIYASLPLVTPFMGVWIEIKMEYWNLGVR